ncbi:MAG: hypothetical protein AB7P14_06690 [Blastocatellales bacterium]
MKKQVLRIAAAIGFLFILSGVSAFAQTPVTADVPFDFNVGNKTLPAGNYKVSKHSTHALALVISNTDQADTAITLSNNITAAGNNEKSKLVFRRYNDKYFLAEVISQGEQVGHGLPMTKAEREIVKEMKSRYLTKNEVKPEIVVIAAGQ